MRSALAVANSLTHADIAAMERELCSRSLAAFSRRAWPILEPATPLKWGWALDATCEHLEAVAAGQITRLLITVPPGSMKSLLTGVLLPAWEWGPKGAAHLRYLGTAHKQELAVRDSTKCRRLITSGWYQALWPVRLVGDQNAKTKFENDKTGFREAMAFTSLTGSRGDRVILDDPHSVDDANSPAHLSAAVTTFREALPTRVNSDDSAIIIIMQRLNEKDVASVALELGYDHLCIPMRYELERAKVTAIGWRDPRKREGELMFPERFSEAQVRKLESSLGTYASAGQLQQRPAPRGGGIFRDEWWQYYQATPRIAWRGVWADTAQKAGEQNDYSVFQCWGRTEDGRAVMLDQIRGKWEAPELLTQARAFWAKHKAVTDRGMLRSFRIEDKVSGTGLIQTLKREGIPVQGIQRKTGQDKISRAMDAAPSIESGLVLLPTAASWLSDFLGEVAAFPSAPHDDQVDAMADAVADIILGRGYSWQGF